VPGESAMDESGTGEQGMVARVVATSAALEAIAQLVAESGPFMFFQSGGCCDGSLPMCFADGEFVIGSHDVLLGEVGVAPSTSMPGSTRCGSTPSSSWT